MQQLVRRAGQECDPDKHRKSKPNLTLMGAVMTPSTTKTISKAQSFGLRPPMFHFHKSAILTGIRTRRRTQLDIDLKMRWRRSTFSADFVCLNRQSSIWRAKDLYWILRKTCQYSLFPCIFHPGMLYAQLFLQVNLPLSYKFFLSSFIEVFREAGSAYEYIVAWTHVNGR